MDKIRDEVLSFWFEELSPVNWFEKNDELDKVIKSKFENIHSRAHQGELFELRKTPLGSLSEIIILDQFSRNIFRNDFKAFSSDPMALALSQVAISKGFDKDLDLVKKSFLYMPFMHSESLEIHNFALKLYDQKGLEENLSFEIKHKEIIEQFGRYPHRNLTLGRESTTEEKEFLNKPGSSF